MGLSSCTRLSLPCQAPEYSNTALHPSCRRNPDTRKGWCDTFWFEIRLLCTTHEILGSILTGKQPAEKLKNQGENWATEVAFWTQQCVQQDGFSHTNPEHCAGIISHSFLLFMFQKKSILPLQTTAFAVLACKNPLSEHGQTF